MLRARAIELDVEHRQLRTILSSISTDSSAYQEWSVRLEALGEAMDMNRMAQADIQYNGEPSSDTKDYVDSLLEKTTGAIASAATPKADAECTTECQVSQEASDHT
jgi:hypothetical protein